MSTHMYTIGYWRKTKSHSQTVPQHSAVHLMLAKSETRTFSAYSIYFDKIFSVIICIYWLQKHWSHFSNNEAFYLGEKWDKHFFFDIVYGSVHLKAWCQSTLNFFLPLNVEVAQFQKGDWYSSNFLNHIFFWSEEKHFLGSVNAHRQSWSGMEFQSLKIHLL